MQLYYISVLAFFGAQLHFLTFRNTFLLFPGVLEVLCRTQNKCWKKRVSDGKFNLFIVCSVQCDVRG